MKEKKKGYKIIFGSCVLVGILSFLIFFITLVNTTDCHKIAKQISRILLENTSVNDDGKDTNYKYSYIDSSSIYAKIDGTDEIVISISKYSSNVEAKAKEEYLKNRYSSLHNIIDGTLLEETYWKDSFDGEQDEIFTEGIYLIRISSYYKDNYEELKKKIISILNKYDIKDIQQLDEKEVKSYWQNEITKLEKRVEDIHSEILNKFNDGINQHIADMENCKGNECEEYLNEVMVFNKYPEAEAQLNLVQQKYDEIINQKKAIVDNINATISNVEINLNENDYESLKKQINDMDDDFYNDYKVEWENRLNAIDENVYKNSCGNYDYKDLLRTPDNYKNQKAYWFGVVQQKVNSSQYRVGVDCEKYHYIDGYSCKNTIYVYYIGDTNIIEDDVLQMWGTMNGVVTYEAIFGNNITIPSFIAKYITVQ